MSGAGVSRRYRRTGVVSARRLTEARAWTTDSGDLLQAAAGDWWVVGRDGRGRGVAADAFAGTYAQVRGDTYRRTGTVTARQTMEREVVQTLEGAATAEPGMWIVTDEAGRSWPVPDEEFRRGYESAP